jgi:hypothetical protein
VRSITCEQTLTSDVTYQGRLLTAREYAASLNLLRELVKGPVSAFRMLKLGEDEALAWPAWVAFAQCGVTEDTLQGTPHPSAEFRWNETRLTPYGQVYAAQRLGKGETR